jgi:hypothetical protein
MNALFFLIRLPLFLVGLFFLLLIGAIVFVLALGLGIFLVPLALGIWLILLVFAFIGAAFANSTEGMNEFFKLSGEFITEICIPPVLAYLSYYRDLFKWLMEGSR